MKLCPLTQKVNDKTFRLIRQVFEFLCVLRALCAFAVNDRGFQDKSRNAFVTPPAFLFTPL